MSIPLLSNPSKRSLKFLAPAHSVTEDVDLLSFVSSLEPSSQLDSWNRSDAAGRSFSEECQEAAHRIVVGEGGNSDATAKK